MLNPRLMFAVLWSLWGISWLVAARWRSQEVRRASFGRSWLYRALLLGGAVLLLVQPHGVTSIRLWDTGLAGARVLALLMLPGFAFAWWARLHLGRLWSSAVTAKPGHAVIRSGPYSLVRHPIYTGILWAVLCSAAAEAGPLAAIGAALMVAGFVVKARLEERFLAEELPAGDYAAYRRQVPMLIPFLPAG